MTPAVLSNPPHQSAPTVEGKHASAVLCLQLPMRPTPITLGLMLAGLAVVYLGLLLWLSGNWRWVEGWIFGVWWVSFASTILLWLHYRDPALLAERFRMPGTGGESRADVAILIGIKVCFLALIVLPALDVRFGWTPRLPLWCEVCGGILVLGGSFPFFRAFTDNTYASQLVRIQTERGLHVIDTGVYGFVRHPMYLGASLVFVGAALLLGSTSALLLGLAMIGLLVVRIFGEEKLLARDLEGYKEYLQKVRYRLVPHIW
ncbi:MAG: isoprenylcysteine carboxylmethyltransferase family protein [Terriglobales bacterium]